MIVCEGMDNTGKSTLAKLLAEDLGFPLQVSIPAYKDVVKSIAQVHDAVLKDIHGEQVIYDRFPLISEYIYGPIIRGESSFPVINPQLTHFLACRPIIIYTRVPIEIIEEWGDREQMDGVKEHAYQIFELYEEMMEALGEVTSVITYDYRLNDYDKLLSRIQLRLKGPQLRKVL